MTHTTHTQQAIFASFVDASTTSPTFPAYPNCIATTGNEMMALLAIECEKFGFELLDEGIYNNDKKLGSAGCTDGRWWVERASSDHQQQVPCDSAFDAVWSLSMVEVLLGVETKSCEELLDQPFDQLTTEEWKRLMEYKPLPESMVLVA